MAYASRPTAIPLVLAAAVLLGLASCGEAVFYSATQSPTSRTGLMLVPLNKGAAVNVTDIDYSALDGTSLNSTKLSIKLGRPTVLSGTVSGTKLNVAAAYLGYPGFEPKGLFVTVKDDSCATYSASLLNTREARSLVKMSKLVVSNAFLDETYQWNQVLAYGAVVSGPLSSGPLLLGPVMTANEVFIKLPASVGPCPLYKVTVCPDATPIRTFYRNPDLCVLPGPCIAKGTICPLFIPACPLGYSLHGWLGETGCRVYACDPDFIQGFPI